MRMTRRRWWSAAALHWDDVSEYKKDRLETSGLFVLRVCGRAFLFILVETRVGHRVSKGVFRRLRTATQGSALRTRSLLKKAGENFHVGAVVITAFRNNARKCHPFQAIPHVYRVRRYRYPRPPEFHPHRE